MKKKKRVQDTPAAETAVAEMNEAVEAEGTAIPDVEGDATGPVAVEPEAVEPDAVEPEVVEHEASEPPAVESSESEVSEPEAAETDTVEAASESSLEEQSAPEANVSMDAAQAAEQFEVETKAGAGETEDTRLKAMLEAIVYVLEEPLPAAQIAQALGQPKELIEKALAELVAESSSPGRGLQIREVAGGFKMSTKPEFHEEIRAFVKKLKPQFKLSQAALETLAVIAYKQPITAPEILEIRGVQGGGVLKTLLERKLVTAAGRKQVVGKPVLYKTTKDFLVQFGLRDLNELPTLKEFEEWSRLAIEEANAEADQEAVERKASVVEESGPAGDAATTEVPADEPSDAGEDTGGTPAPESAEPEPTAPEQPETTEPSGSDTIPPVEEVQSPMPEEPQTNASEDNADKPPPEILDGQAETGGEADKPPPEILDGSASIDK